MTKKNYKILVIDDHPVVLEGIKRIASMSENVECDGILEVEELKNCFSSRPPYDMYILDLEFPKADGVSVLNQLRENAADSRILIYTMHEEPWELAKLIDADIDGLISKNADISELQKAISSLRNGEIYFNDQFLSMIRNGKEYYIDNEKKDIRISPREEDVLFYILKGYTTKQIAISLFRSPDTIKTHRKRLMFKFRAKNAADLAFKAKDYFKPNGLFKQNPE